MSNLEKYFRECDHNRVIDHALRATVTNDKVKFYIHPINANGDTLDFEVQGNVLTQLNVKKPEEVISTSTKSMADLEKCFEVAKETNQKFIGVLIQMAGYEKPELIINETENFDSKLAYYKKAYNEDLTLKTFNGIKIVAFAFGIDLNNINDYLKNNPLSRI